MLEYLQKINENTTSNIEIAILALLLLLVFLIIKRKKHKKTLKRAKYRKVKPGFYNTGYKCSFSLRDVIKLKLRFADYCDKQGVQFHYFLSIKLFNFELCRMKYTDQKGQVFKRKIRFGS
jgi:hypothetical protein